MQHSGCWLPVTIVGDIHAIVSAGGRIFICREEEQIRDDPFTEPGLIQHDLFIGGLLARRDEQIRILVTASERPTCLSNPNRDRLPTMIPIICPCCLNSLVDGLKGIVPMWMCGMIGIFGRDGKSWIDIVMVVVEVGKVDEVRRSSIR